MSTNADAAVVLGDGEFDVVVSDVGGPGPDTGLALAGTTGGVPLVYYVTESGLGVQGVPRFR